MVTLQSLGPIENYNFWWCSNLHSVDRSHKKKRMEANVLGRHLAKEVHLNQRRWWLYNFGPHRKLGSNLHSVVLSQKECTEANVRASTGQHINSTNPEQRYGPGRIWARDHLLPRLLQNAPGAWGGGFKWKITVLDSVLPLPLVTQLATASFREIDMLFFT